MSTLSKYPGLEAALELYFDVLHDCDLEKFDRIFHPACNLYCLNDGAVSVVPLDRYRGIVAGRTPPASLGFPREGEVNTVLAASGDVVVVSLRSRVAEKRFSDLLSLAREADGWKIVAKTYALRDIVA
jgi:hypothetical protein